MKKSTKRRNAIGMDVPEQGVACPIFFINFVIIVACFTIFIDFCYNDLIVNGIFSLITP